MKTLPKKAKCPLHGGYYCCGRARPSLETRKFPSHNGIIRYPDGREKCSPAILTFRKGVLLKKNPFCAACGKLFDDYRDVELAHIECKGSGGFKHDDRWENLVLMHRDENREQGSRSLNDYLRWRIEKRLPVPEDALRKQIHAVEAI
jgi:5-methylcytosine-specific restriction endonuclease McrA